jgi:hypothetical protein
MKRQRGRGRKPGHHNSSNRTFESTGPDIKVRGPAAHVYEKYLQLARDASSSGDRVMAENYQQHAEHYYRVLRTMQPQVRPEHEPRLIGDGEYDDEDGAEGVEGETEADEPQERQQQQQQRPPREHREHRDRDRDRREQRAPRERVEASEPGEGADGGDEEPGAGDGGGRRGRRRRRFRPGEGRDGSEGGDSDRPVEGFGDQLPAFVAGE